MIITKCDKCDQEKEKLHRFNYREFDDESAKENVSTGTKKNYDLCNECLFDFKKTMHSAIGKYIGAKFMIAGWERSPMWGRERAWRINK